MRRLASAQAFVDDDAEDVFTADNAAALPKFFRDSGLDDDWLICANEKAPPPVEPAGTDSAMGIRATKGPGTWPAEDQGRGVR